jgi:hypothetical protein
MPFGLPPCKRCCGAFYAVSNAEDPHHVISIYVFFSMSILNVGFLSLEEHAAMFSKLRMLLKD